MPPARSDDQPLPLASLARLREQTYRLVSRSLLYPDDERLRLIAGAARSLDAAGPSLARLAPFPQWRRLTAAAAAIAGRSVADLEGRYVALFMAGAPVVPCPPYESSYGEGEVAASGWVQAELQRWYARAGLELSPDVAEPLDHVALEFEFMALLCGHEAEAWEQAAAEPDGPEIATRLLGEQRRFLEAHLCDWFPRFAACLAEADRGGDYAALARPAGVVLAHDRDLAAALLAMPPVAGAAGVSAGRGPAR